MARVITRDFDAATIREAMVEIIGETLDVDRTLIYDIRFIDEVADGLCEWLNPAAEGVEPTINTYPLSVFRGGVDEAHQTRRHIVSHVDEVHAALIEDGSGELLHGAMSIKSLLWYPFDFEEDRFFVLVFNQVRHRRQWSANDVEFVESLAELVSMAHLRMRLESQRREREQRSEQMRRLEGLGLLAGGVAHDFNNLLTAILGNATMIERMLPAEGPSKRLIGNMKEAAESAADMCKQLLTYAGRGSGGLSLCDLNELVERTVSMIDGSLARAVCVALDEGPVWIQGDRTQIQQLLLNLLTNASDALDGSGQVRVLSGFLSAAEAEAKGMVLEDGRPRAALPYLRVEDSGRGMDDATKARMFEPFFSTKDGGHGLGLAATHGVLSAHRAFIDVASEVGDGTTVTIVFPATEQHPEAEGESVDDRHRDGRAATVLVVDDEKMVRQVCESVLVLDGYQVVTASSGKRALEICADVDERIDLVVMDVGMTELDGKQTFGRLRAAGHTFPVLMISAHPIDVNFKHAGYDGWSFLQKPFAPAALLAVVKTLLDASMATNVA